MGGGQPQRDLAVDDATRLAARSNTLVRLAPSLARQLGAVYSQRQPRSLSCADKRLGAAVRIERLAARRISLSDEVARSRRRFPQPPPYLLESPKQ